MTRPTVRAIPLALLATLAVVVVVSSAACSGGGGGGGGDDETPTPTPVFVADRCQIVWENDVSPSVVDLYLLDAPVGAWVLSSTHQYAFTTSGFFAAFFGGLDLNTGDFDTSVVASAGTFALTLNGTEAGRSVSFEDADVQALYTLDTAGNPLALAGTGGTGVFDGLWSDPYSQNVTAGNGSVTVAFDGTSRTLGVDLSYAVCYTGSGDLFRPSHRRLR